MIQKSQDPLDQKVWRINPATAIAIAATEFPHRNMELKFATGVLFRLDPDLSLHRVKDPVEIPNGISWSQDEKTVYFTDSPTGEIKQYPYDSATGSIDFSAGKTFFKCPHEGGVPDG